MDLDSDEDCTRSDGSTSSSSQQASDDMLHPLLPHEIWWRDRSVFLESKGYRLRPRFQPGWTRSWLGTGKDPFWCEDSFIHMIRRVMDAKRISDGALVAIKQVWYRSNEAKIAMMFSTPEAMKDPFNHCVPILDHFQDETDKEHAYIVMPLLRQFNEPEFYVVSEVMDFVRQSLEGLVYMHKRKVAHCDLSFLNIMMDGSALYPRGFHPDPAWQSMLPDFSARAKYKLRSDVQGVKYYFVDFGISAYYGDSDEPPLAYGDDGLDRELPELYWGKPYDPFPGDVFLLGNVYRRFFIEKYTNLSALEPLANAMTQQDPENRPTAEEALARFEELASTMITVSARWRLRPVKETRIRCAALEAYWAMREVSFVIRSVFLSPYTVAAVVPVTLATLVALHCPRRMMDRIRALFTPL